MERRSYRCGRYCALTLAGTVYAFKKKVIEPEEQKAAFIEENRKEAARRRVAHKPAHFTKEVGPKSVIRWEFDFVVPTLHFGSGAVKADENQPSRTTQPLRSCSTFQRQLRG